ncbi:hypothetical protein FRAHR75_470025 [Frankia sp. Hr75.2]|nr:hypothetical protein FRAHR75_470025 [Frankia sp. Hr75.2]
MVTVCDRGLGGLRSALVIGVGSGEMSENLGVRYGVFVRSCVTGGPPARPPDRHSPYWRVRPRGPSVTSPSDCELWSHRWL